MADANHFIVKNGTIIDVEYGGSFLGQLKLKGRRLRGYTRRVKVCQKAFEQSMQLVPISSRA